MQQQTMPILNKNEQFQTLINILGALDSIKIIGSDAPLFVQVRAGLETVLNSIKDELSKTEQQKN